MLYFKLQSVLSCVVGFLNGSGDHSGIYFVPILGGKLVFYLPEYLQLSCGRCVNFNYSWEDKDDFSTNFERQSYWGDHLHFLDLHTALSLVNQVT